MGTVFFGDIVLDGFNMSYLEKDSILEQKYEKQISWDLHYEDYEVIEENCIFKEKQHITSGSSKNWVLGLPLCQ